MDSSAKQKKPAVRSELLPTESIAVALVRRRAYGLAPNTSENISLSSYRQARCTNFCEKSLHYASFKWVAANRTPQWEHSTSLGIIRKLPSSQGCTPCSDRNSSRSSSDISGTIPRAKFSWPHSGQSHENAGCSSTIIIYTCLISSFKATIGTCGYVCRPLSWGCDPNGSPSESRSDTQSSTFIGGFYQWVRLPSVANVSQLVKKS